MKNMVAIAKVLKLIPSLALAFAALSFIPSASDFTSDFSSSCPSYPRIGHPDIGGIMSMGVDGFLCMLCLASKISSIQSLERFVSLGYLMSLFISCFAFMAVEGSRFRAGFLLSLTPLYAVFFQLLGLSVVFPLLWLPLYLLYGCDERTPENAWRMGISLPRVVAIAMSVIVFFQFIAIATFFPFEDAGRTGDYFGLTFLFFPVLIPFAWVPFKGKTRGGAHEAVIAMHLVLAGSGIVCHLLGLVAIVHNPDLPARILGLLCSHPVGAGAAHSEYFTIINLLFMTLSLLYLITLEAGPVAMLAAINGIVFLGPAATFSIYFALREQQIIQVVAIGGTPLTSESD